MNDSNKFAALRREASAPHAQTPEAEPKVQTIPPSDTEPAVVSGPTSVKPAKPDVSQAPGEATYAQTLKDAPSTPEPKHRKSKAGEPLSNEPNYQFAQQHAERAGDKASEAAKRGKESLQEAGKAAKQTATVAKAKASDAASEAESKASEAASATREKAHELNAAAGERLAHARETVGEYAQAARERVTEAAEGAKEQAQRGAEYVREHVPHIHVEHVDEPLTPGEAASQSVLDEAMALSTGTEPMPQTAAAQRTISTTEKRPEGLTSNVVRGSEDETVLREERLEKRMEPRVKGRAVEAADTAAAKAREAAPEEVVRRGDAEARKRGEQPGTAEGLPGAAVGVADTAAAKARDFAPEEVVRRGDAAARKRGEQPGTAEGLPGAVVGVADTVAAKAREAAPEDVVRRGDAEARKRGEEPGTAEGFVGAVVGAAQYVKEHIPGLSRHSPPRPHEYRALPGDVHIAQVSHAVRDTLSGVMGRTEEKFHDAEQKARATRQIHQETDAHRAARYATGESVALSGLADEAYASAYERSQRNEQPTKEKVKSAAESSYDTAKSKTGEATETVKESASEVASTVNEKLHHVAEKVSESVHAAGDKARWAVEHTRDEAHKSMSKLQEEMQPKTPEEAAIAQGEIPSDTQTVKTGHGV